MSWIVVIMAIVNFIILIKNLLSSGEKKLEQRADKVEAKLIEHDRRIQAIENDMKHIPDKETTHRMEMTMMTIVSRLDKQDAVLEGRFSSMDEKLKPIQAIGERLNDVLIDQMKKAS
ncbi:hypothetical protein GA0004734_00033740 [Rhizobium sp. 9140]|nr:hypothetical protein GA0004734_00033740 [Rhizobium sp. 9140]